MPHKSMAQGTKLPAYHIHLPKRDQLRLLAAHRVGCIFINDFNKCKPQSDVLGLAELAF